MSGFFVADDKIPMKESYVAIPSQNGLSYDAQKLIEFFIPPNVENFKPNLLPDMMIWMLNLVDSHYL